MAQSLSGARRPEIPALTSLRFFAALWVVLFHVHEIGLNRGGPAPYLDFALLGYLGVSFFFVLSGFILVYVYAGRPVPKRRFWQARFARIYPAYFFSLLLTVGGLIHFWPMVQARHLGTLTLVAYPLLLEAWFPQILLTWNPVAWTLSAEAVFYLLFPFILPRLAALTWPRLRLCLAAFWITSLILTGAYVLLRPDGVAHPTLADNDLFWLGVVKLNPLVRLPEFLLGMGTGLAFLRLPTAAPHETIGGEGNRPAAGNGPLALGAALLLLAIALGRHIPYPMLHSGLLAPAFALLIFGFATQPAWTRPLASKPLILLGESSYSLYLLHGIVIVLFMLALGHSSHLTAVTLASIATSILISVAVYLLLENPLRRLLHPRYAAPMVPLPTPATATT